LAISPDIMLIVRALEQEGFSALAGELLTEISLGRELDLDDGQGTGIEDVGVSTEGIAPETSLQWQPILEDQQLEVAVNFLRLRLVEPVRYLAEAERIASEFSSDKKRAEGQEATKQISLETLTQIIFIDPDSFTPSSLVRGERAGGKESADRLDAVLARLAEQAI
jgi:hypothetical protein